MQVYSHHLLILVGVCLGPALYFSVLSLLSLGVFSLWLKGVAVCPDNRHRKLGIGL